MSRTRKAKSGRTEQSVPFRRISFGHNPWGSPAAERRRRVNGKAVFESEVRVHGVPMVKDVVSDLPGQEEDFASGGVERDQRVGQMILPREFEIGLLGESRERIAEADFCWMEDAMRDSNDLVQLVVERPVIREGVLEFRLD